MNLETKEAFVFMGVPCNSTREQEQMAYLKLSKKYHPDMPGGSAALFQMLKDSHDTCKKHFEEIEAEAAGVPVQKIPSNDNVIAFSTAISLLERLKAFENLPGLLYSHKKILREAESLLKIIRENK